MPYNRDDRALHIPSGRMVRVWQAAKDGSWVTVYFDGVKRGKKVPGSDLRSLTRPKEENAAVTEVDRQEFGWYRPLCDDCRNATPLCCPYLGFRDINAGLAVVGARAVVTQLSGAKELSYKIVDCAEHFTGQLPPWGRVHSGRQ